MIFCKRYNTKAVGSHYEHLAEVYLRQQGLTLVQRNFSCRFGEIDIIMRQGQQWVFVEVKYRRQTTYGGAVAAITAKKQQKLLLTAKTYWQLKQIPVSQQLGRFDILAIDGGINKNKINWLRNAFYD